MSGAPAAQEETMARIREAVAVVRNRTPLKPRVGIMTGTGLAGVAEEVEVEAVLSYEEIPHFPLPTVEAYSGRLTLGRLSGTPVAVLQGRAHRYEGYSLQEATFPVRALKLLEAETLVVSSISGGMNPLWRRGELVLLDDHINLLGDNPLVGENLDELGPRFPDMSEPYDRELRAMAAAAALRAGIRLNRGIYAALPGPNSETRGEYRMLRKMGADVVGRSTVPEVIVARHMGMRVLGLSLITAECLPDAREPTNTPDVVEIALEDQRKITTLIRDVVGRL